MKKSLRAVSLALCAATLVSFTACFGGGGGVGGGNVTYGRYVEEDITPPGMQGSKMSFYYNEDGVMDLVTEYYDEETDRNTFGRYRSEDGGESWQTLDMSWTLEYTTDYSALEDGEEPEKHMYLGLMQVMPDGSVLASASAYYPEEERSEYSLISASMSGEVTPPASPFLAAIGEAGEDIYLNSIQMLDDTRVALNLYAYEPLSSSSVEALRSVKDNDGQVSGVFDINTGEQLIDFSQYDAWGRYYSNDTLYIEYENSYTAYSLADGSQVQEALPDGEMIGMAGIYPDNYSGAIGPGHTFYGINNKGLMKVAPGDEEPVQLMEGLNYTYGSPVCWVNGLYVSGDEFLMCVHDEMEGPRFLRYVWDAKAPATSDKHLRVYSLYENQGVRLGLAQFKRENPEITVSYDTALNYRGSQYMAAENEGGGMTPEDALRALSTELLAGNGPDVLILDDLPLQSYIDRGILEDISDAIEGVDVFESVIDPLRNDKGLYVVPSHFSIPMLFGQKGKVGEYATLDAFVAEVLASGQGRGAWPDYESMTDEEYEEFWQEDRRPLAYDERPMMQFDSLDEVVSMLYETSAPAMYAEATGLDKAALRTYLETVKAISDHYGLATERLTSSDEESYIIAMGGTLFGGASSLENYGRHRAKTGYTQFASAYTLNSLGFSEYDSQHDWVYDEENDTYEEILREDAQSQTSDAILAPGLAEGVYFPQNLVGVCSTSKQKDVAKEFIVTMLGYEVQKYNWYSNGLPLNREAFDRMWAEDLEPSEYTKELGIKPVEIDIDGLIDGLKTPYFTNEYLLQVIYDNVVPYCLGAQSLDATIDTIVKETDIYFAERQ